MDHSDSFKKLEPYLKKIRRFRYLSGVLYYDLATVCPEKSIDDEGELLNSIDGEIAEVMQDKAFIRIIDEGLNDPKATPMEARLFDNLHEQVLLLEKMPIEEYLAYCNAITKSNEMWRLYRPKNDFAGWLPYWQHLVDLSRHVADLRHKDGQKTRYDACLSSYEPGENEAYIDGIFTPLKKELIALLKTAKEKQKKYRQIPLKPYDENKQRALGLKMLEIIHYDMKGGQMMVSAHPFSNDMHIHDARLTTKYLVNDWRSNVFTCLHEGGHCLEFQNKPQEMYDNYVESLATSALCETHSRFYENLIGRDYAFMPLMKEACAETLDPAFKDMPIDDFYHQVNRIEPWLIRCEADEISYCLHIIIRYEIERDLINGKIECKDVPELWNAKYKEYLGLDVPNDKDGCMQDTHWSEALWGYFPSYALGNLYGAMIRERMIKEINLEERIRTNDFGTILKWFADNDYRYDWMQPDDWIMKVTGKHLTSEPYIAYLKEKFSK